MPRSHTFRSLVLLPALLSAACSADNPDTTPGDPTLRQNCGASTYRAADPANHANQDARVAAQAQINAAIQTAIGDPAESAHVFSDVEALYTTSADLKTKVAGRKDDHFPGDAAADTVGGALDAEITRGIAEGKAATTALAVRLAKQRIDKSLTRFFYLSVYHELVLGSRAKYDEAYGYLGTGPAVDSPRLSLAAVAQKRDGDNGTSYASALHAAILAGSCALDTALLAAGADKIAWRADAGYEAAVLELDRLMQEVLALSVGHEFFRPFSELTLEEAQVKLLEGALYFGAVEPYMLVRGGAVAADAADIRARLDAALAAVEADPATWNKDAFDAAGIREKVAAAFGVTVKG